MKLFLFLLCLSTSIFAQDFTDIKSKTDVYARSFTADKLAKKIQSDFSSKEDQVKAIYAWLTKNIRYDLQEFYHPTNKTSHFRYRTLEEKEAKIQALKDKQVSATLSSRKAVCEGYAQTFAKVCNLLHIENEIIKGYARASFNEIGKPLQQSNHAWNAVKINKKWIYIDATWGAGHTNNGKWERMFKSYFFDMKKKNYFKTHLPEESIWRLRVARMDKTTFYNQPIYSYSFLQEDYNLVNKTSGFLKVDKNGKIHIPIGNMDSTKKIHFGFVGEKFAKEADITIKNGVTIASVIVPRNVTYVSLLIDLDLMVSFKII